MSTSQTEIWTERLFLRAAESRDLRYFRKWFCDSEVMKFWSTPHTDVEQTQKFLDNMIASPFNGIMNFSVCLADSSVATVTENTTGCCESEEGSYIVIGKAGLYDGKKIGYIFDREYWGKGYAFEALDAILRHVWALELEGIVAPEVIKANVDPRNVASLRLLGKLGFVKVGSAKNTFETNLGWCDSVYLEVKKPLEAEEA
ncbi:acyl-CoA N-acyltransferase [Pholiota conissans]|uniref:Acyl-CoA N-acyltransferase n=1 Tax=Pholiota conissans TaxID=109636 RepID=A0A9P6D4X9_9AGAR|nr:acyl-CoA N-acyltransferase [Pholiota conissans]